MTAWNPETGKRAAKKNTIIAVFGKAKTGKSRLATTCTGPLYYAHFDPNDSLDEQLVRRHEEGFEGEAYVQKYPPIPYKDLTEEKAGEYVKSLEDFAKWAREKAVERDAQGLPGGVFVIDGAKRLKGYIEKWLLGESATLGYRARSGERGVTSIQYAESNNYLADIINAFVGAPIHLLVTFEGKDEWQEVRDENGKKTRRPTGRVQSTMPQSAAFSIRVVIETLVEETPLVVNNKRVGSNFEHKLRFDFVGFDGMGHLRGKTVPAITFDQLLALLHSKIPSEELVEEPHEIVRANMEGFTVVEDEDE